MAGLPEADFIVVGAGVAGLRAAIGLASHGARVLVVTKEALAESNTHYAQGGIAVAMSGDEDVALHLEDTVNAGAGLVDREAARVLVEEGPERVDELLNWGTEFDTEGGALMLTREGAHSRNRILHAHGDATGAEIARSLLRRARSIESITLLEWMTTVSLVTEDRTVLGVDLLLPDGRIERIPARAVLLASGGAGQVYSDTTNPAVATGDGIAMAWRAGAAIADMEFYQFHPTALSLPGVPRFLISEALRGEGAWLRNARDERFMARYHPLLELAPRDVVARAITRESIGPHGEQLAVVLDMTHVARIHPETRFPGISHFLAAHGLNLRRDTIPVRPAAHYLMGGIRTDLYGLSSLEGLYAAGEAACTGVHGANRLASNSLLEGLVFGARAAEAMLVQATQAPTALPDPEPREPQSDPQVTDLRDQLQRLMWNRAGLLRDGEGLRAGHRELAALQAAAPAPSSRPAIELQNLLTVAELILTSALAREESRGAHYRNDFPQPDDQRFARHSVVRGAAVTFEDF